MTDTDVISYFWTETDRTEAAREVRRLDSDWHVPHLWQSEFRNVLYQHMSGRDLALADALLLAEAAEADVQEFTHSLATADVLGRVQEMGPSTYDCEYVVLPQGLGVFLVTGDVTGAERFPPRSSWRTSLGESRGTHSRTPHWG